jgi:hypothetical protein
MKVSYSKHIKSARLIFNKLSFIPNCTTIDQYDNLDRDGLCLGIIPEKSNLLSFLGFNRFSCMSRHICWKAFTKSYLIVDMFQAFIPWRERA